MVGKYTGLSIYDVLDMPYPMFLINLKCAFIDKMNETEEGRKYLEDCKRLNTTSLDKNAFRRLNAKLSK